MTGVASLLADALAEGVRQYLNDMMSVSTAESSGPSEAVKAKAKLSVPSEVVKPKLLPKTVPEASDGVAKPRPWVVFVPKTPLAKPKSIVFITQPKKLPRQPAGPPPRSLLVKALYFVC